MSLPRRVYLNLVAFVALFAVLLLWAIDSVLDPASFGDTYPVAVEFADATGLRSGVEVTFRGVRVGEVDGVDVESGFALAKLEISSDRSLPIESTFVVRRRSAVGEPYVAVEPPDGWDGSGPLIPTSGDVHRTESSRSPLAYGQLFDAADALLAEVDEDDLGTVIDELAAAFGGRGDELRRIIRGTGDVSATFADEIDVFDTLTVELADLTAILADEAETIGASVDDLDLLVGAIADSRADIEMLLDDVPPLAARVSLLLDASEASLRCGQRSSAVIGEALGDPQTIDQISRLLRAAETAASVIPKAIFDGPDGRYLSGTFGFAPGEFVDYEEFEEFAQPPSLDGCPEISTGPPDGLEASDLDSVDSLTGGGGMALPTESSPTPAEEVSSPSDLGSGQDSGLPTVVVLAASLGALAVTLIIGSRVVPALWRRRRDEEDHVD